MLNTQFSILNAQGLIHLEMHFEFFVHQIGNHTPKYQLSKWILFSDSKIYGKSQRIINLPIAPVRLSVATVHPVISFFHFQPIQEALN